MSSYNKSPLPGAFSFIMDHTITGGFWKDKEKQCPSKSDFCPSETIHSHSRHWLSGVMTRAK